MEFEAITTDVSGDLWMSRSAGNGPTIKQYSWENIHQAVALDTEIGMPISFSLSLHTWFSLSQLHWCYFSHSGCPPPLPPPPSLTPPSPPSPTPKLEMLTQAPAKTGDVAGDVDYSPPGLWSLETLGAGEKSPTPPPLSHTSYLLSSAKHFHLVCSAQQKACQANYSDP
jgi:hypothetical protein